MYLSDQLQCILLSDLIQPLINCDYCKTGVVSKFGDYRNSDGISSEGKSSDYFKKKISVSANSVSIFWALKYIESKLSD